MFKKFTRIFSGIFRWHLSGEEIIHLPPDFEGSMLGAGKIYKGRRFVTHSTIHHSRSAITTFTRWQKAALAIIFISLVAGVVVDARLTAVIAVALLTANYFVDIFFNLFLVGKSLNFPPEIHFTWKQLKALRDDHLPTYTILCPLYREVPVLSRFVKAMSALSYPKDKLEVLLLLESDDTETIRAARKMLLPDNFRILVVPESLPKTKPKACNYGLNHARGEYTVIYDAEDRPDPWQLKKAILAFKSGGPRLKCLQAKLNYYNSHQNLLTRLFTAEYNLWFDVILPGLQSIETVIPLGGTSNHFRTAELRQLQGWDSFNVAEDADLGIRLFRDGGKTAMIDSVTWEEANSGLFNWIRQRSRWLKGYMQTYLVHMRQPLKFAKEHRGHWLIFQLISGLRIAFVFINPVMWLLTLAYFLLYRWVGSAIEAIYPAPVFYMAATSTVFGNFLYLYYYMIGAAKRQQWPIIKYVLLVPFYWLMTSVAAVVALYQLAFRPHFWEKTVHGLYQPEIVKGSNRKGVWLVAASLVGSAGNFLYNAYLGRKLNLSDFGLVSLIAGFVYAGQILLTAVSRSVAYRSAYLLGKYKNPVKEFWLRSIRVSGKYSLVVAGLWLSLLPFLTRYFKTNSAWPLLVFTPVWLVGLGLAVNHGWLLGNHFFAAAGLFLVFEAAIKLIAAVFLVESGRPAWVYLSIPAASVGAFLLSWFYLALVKTKQVRIDFQVAAYFPKKFFAASLVNNLSTMAWLGLDVVLAKIFLSPEDAGRYALLSLTGKMIYFIGGLFNQLIIPLISKSHGEGSAGAGIFYRLLLLSAGASGVAYVALGMFGSLTAPVLFGPKMLEVLTYLPLYGGAIWLQTVGAGIVAFEQVKGRQSFIYLGFISSVVQIGGMLFWHRNINDLVLVVAAGAAGYLAALAVLYLFYGQITMVLRNALDFFGLFQPPPLPLKERPGNLRILIFNWRDTRHVWAGGAEVYLHEIGKRLVKLGHRVTLFCGNDGRCPRNEKIGGIQIVRRGGFYTVYIWAVLYYLLRFRKFFDVIIDSENGIPFFTPLYSRKKIFLLIHHVHQEVFRLRLKPPLSWLGQLLEKYLMPLVYRNVPVITVSPSSKAAILAHRLTQKEPEIIYNGVDLNQYRPGGKSPDPLVLYLGRLMPQKSLPVLIRAAAKIVANIPRVKFVIAGDGEDKNRLMDLVDRLNLKSFFTFTGKVSEAAKIRLYQKAWVFVNPSLIEGWGITTIEANACGTPVVAANVPGLRDAVSNPHTGLLVPYGRPEPLAEAVQRLLFDAGLRRSMGQKAIAWAEKFNWSRSCQRLLEFL